jgi:hypothetical protein
MDLALDDTNAVFSALVLIKSQIFLSSFHSFFGGRWEQTWITIQRQKSLGSKFYLVLTKDSWF